MSTSSSSSRNSLLLWLSGAFSRVFAIIKRVIFKVSGPIPSFDGYFSRLLHYSISDEAVTGLSGAIQLAENKAIPLFVLAHNRHAVANFVSVFSDPEVKRCLENTVKYGFDPVASLNDRLAAKSLQLERDTTSIKIIIPLRLSPHIASRFQLRLHGTGGNIYSSRQSDFSASQQTEIINQIQETFALISSTINVKYGDFSLTPLKAGILQCYNYHFTRESQPEDLIQELTTVLKASLQLVEPLKCFKLSIESKRQADRDLIARQQIEYQDAVKADLERTRIENERKLKIAEENRVKVEESEQNRLIQEAINLRNLEACKAFLTNLPRDPQWTESDFAKVIVRTDKERLKLRTHRHLPVSGIQTVLEVVNYFEPHSEIWIQPSVEDHLISCKLITSASQCNPIKLPTRFKLSMGQTTIDPDKTVDQTPLMPSAVVHITPATINTELILG